MDPLRDYYDDIRNAPVPERLMAETPPEAFLKRLTIDLAWAAIGIAMVAAVMAIPATPDIPKARIAAGALGNRVAMNEVSR